LEEEEYEAKRERERIAMADAGWRQEEDKYWEVVPNLIPKLNPKLNPVGGRKKKRRWCLTPKLKIERKKEVLPNPQTKAQTKPLNREKRDKLQVHRRNPPLGEEFFQTGVRKRKNNSAQPKAIVTRKFWYHCVLCTRNFWYQLLG
jgi:hypothetical protein